jgi:hypothetical protein
MSDARVRAAIEQMEAWIGDPNWEPDPVLLETWNTAYQSAVANAEKGEGWSDLVARAHVLGKELEPRIAHLVRLRDQVKAELDAQGRGNRALIGYGASTR